MLNIYIRRSLKSFWEWHLLRKISTLWQKIQDKPKCYCNLIISDIFMIFSSSRYYLENESFVILYFIWSPAAQNHTMLNRHRKVNFKFQTPRQRLEIWDDRVGVEHPPPAPYPDTIFLNKQGDNSPSRASDQRRAKEIAMGAHCIT